MKDYSSHFNPSLQLADLDHGLLAHYAREVMLANHIHDRSALSVVTLEFGTQAQTDVACDEWMSTSPIYNARLRKLLNAYGDDVGSALKGFQFDIGAPHNFAAFHYELISPDEGYFWLADCGPYNYIHDVTNADHEAEVQLCVHMEDPTFDATVMAVNPLMRCTPIHRPPFKKDEVPEEGPCKWLVSVQREIGIVEDCPLLEDVQGTLAANFEFVTAPQDGAGMTDYSGAFKRDFRLEDLTHSTLETTCKEFMLDVFLLNYSCHHSVASRFGEDKIASIAQQQYHHLAPLTVHRLRKCFQIEGDNMDAILKVLQLNPFLPRDYFNVGLAQTSDTRGLIWLNDCEGYREPRKRGIASLMVTDPQNPGFVRLAQEVNPKTIVRPIDPSEIKENCDSQNVQLAWEIIVDESAETAPRSDLADVIAHQMWDIDNATHRYSYDYYDALKGA
jgi:hypothetical protein